MLTFSHPLPLQRYMVTKEIMAAKRREYHLRKQLTVREAKARPCTDCGIQYPYYVMQFDHLRDKNFELSRNGISGHSMDSISAEIEKCEVVCANCHMVRTWARVQASLAGSDLR